MIESSDIQLIGRLVADAIKKYDEKRSADLSGIRGLFEGHLVSTRGEVFTIIDELRAAIAAIPAGKDGRDGKDGERGEKGDSIIGPQGEKGDKGDPGESIIGPKGDKGDIGERGERGESVIGPKGDKGDPGETVIGPKGEKGDVGERGEKGDRGESIVGPPGANGRDGRDAAQLEILPTIDPTKSYPRGTWARLDCGIAQAYRNTIPNESDLAKAGWEIMVPGFRLVDIEQSEDLRSFKVRMAWGDKEESKMFSMPVMLHRGIYSDSGEYNNGDVVQWHGSAWICKRDGVSSAPVEDNRDWELLVKRGRNADAIKPPKPQEHKIVRLK